MLLFNKFLFILFLVFSPAVLLAGEIVDDTLQALQIDDAAGVARGLQRGMDVNFVDAHGNSLLMMAARFGSTQSTAVLINAGARVHLSNQYGDTALLIAALNGNEALVNMLLAKRASLEANPLGWTPLHYAAYGGHDSLVRKFLGFKANPNATTSAGLTPLMVASLNGHIRVVRTLLGHSADASLRDANNLLAADHALKNRNTDIAELLSSSLPKR